MPASQSVAALDERAAVALDDEAVLASSTRFTSRADGTREAQTLLALSGIHCSACAGLIERALCAEVGVSGAQVNAERERALVRWDPERTRAALLIDAVRRAGYSAHPAQSEPAFEAQRRAERLALWRLFVAAFCAMQVMMVATPSYLATAEQIGTEVDQLLRWAGWVLSLPVMLFCATPFFGGAWRALGAGRVGMDLPVALAILIAFGASTAATFAPGGALGDALWFDSLTMFVAFLLAGRWLEQRLRGRSQRALDALLRRLPDSVEWLGADGSFALVPVARLVPGDRVRVAAGQVVPGDGVVLEGRGTLDEALLSGESRPVERGPGDAVVAGSLNLEAALLLRIDRVGADTRQQQIHDLVERATLARPPALRLADRLAAPFTLAVVALAALAWWGWTVIDPVRALPVAVAVLVVSCPCALAIAAPTALLAAASSLARDGVLVQRLEAIEALATVDCAAFDKTGTLSDERLALVTPPADAPLAAAAALAAHSRHPLARALGTRAPTDAPRWHDILEHPGAGLEAGDDQGRRWRLGHATFVGADAGTDPGRPSLCFAPLDAPLDAWRFEFDERPRTGATQLLAALRYDGVRVLMLSGDRAAAVQALAQRLGVGEWHAELKPEDKRDQLLQLQRDGHRVLVVGDGLNDAPAIAQADVSIALGHGVALAQLRADFVALGSRLPAIAGARTLARRTISVMRQNLGWALTYNALALPLAASGWLTPWQAGLGMAASSLLVIVNSTRLLSGPALNARWTPANAAHDSSEAT